MCYIKFMDLATLLQNRIIASQNGTLKQQLEFDAKEYNKRWAAAVQCFQKKINEDRKRDKQPELSFIVIRQKLAHVKEIDDLRWFYIQCLKYRNRKLGRTFSKCFFGALKVTNT